MSSKVYPGLRDKPEFAQILADYDRVSELLGDAQNDIRTMSVERDHLRGLLAEAARQRDEWEAKAELWGQFADVEQERAATLRGLLAEASLALEDWQEATSGSYGLKKQFCAALIARIRAALAGDK